MHPEFLGTFQKLHESYMQSMNVLNVKKILVFKDTNKPTKLEHNIGIALLLLFTFVDPDIRMSNDR